MKERYVSPEALKPDQLRRFMQTEPPGGWDFWNPEAELKLENHKWLNIAQSSEHE